LRALRILCLPGLPGADVAKTGERFLQLDETDEYLLLQQYAAV
jgi:hypothetical protein